MNTDKATSSCEAIAANARDLGDFMASTPSAADESAEHPAHRATPQALDRKPTSDLPIPTGNPPRLKPAGDECSRYPYTNSFMSTDAGSGIAGSRTLTVTHRGGSRPSPPLFPFSP
jgi:hypothetical protein